MTPSSRSRVTLAYEDVVALFAQGCHVVTVTKDGTATAR
jgi:hypothetical protein